MKRLGVALTSVALLAGCPDKVPSPTAPASAPAPRATASAPNPVLRDPRRFDCKTDADCSNSCRWGAVSASWYARAEKQPDFQECHDGCANQISAPPRCEAGACVAYQVDPQDESKISQRPHCTRVER